MQHWKNSREEKMNYSKNLRTNMSVRHRVYSHRSDRVLSYSWMYLLVVKDVLVMDVSYINYSWIKHHGQQRTFVPCVLVKREHPKYLPKNYITRDVPSTVSYQALSYRVETLRNIMGQVGNLYMVEQAMVICGVNSRMRNHSYHIRKNIY